MALPIVAVVGRPNVGKSTFVNRIAQADEAIVHEMRGVTRDRSYHIADWNGVPFKLIDTGGIEMGDDDAFQSSIRTQAFAGVNEADVIVFIVDGRTGINADDEEVARVLRKTSKPVYLVVNKMDNPDTMDQVWEFYQLGLGDPWSVSSLHGNGTGDLLDAVVEDLKKVETADDEEEDGGINIAIIGRPNAGKSSLTASWSPTSPAPRATPSTPSSSTTASATPSSTPPACARRARSTRTWSTTASCAPCAPSTAPTWRSWSSTAPSA